MASGRQTFVRVLALLGALAVAGPADAAWSGECAPVGPEAQLAGIGDALEQGLAKTPPTVASVLAAKHATKGTRIDVPFLAQSGSTCGFYAAGMVLAHFRGEKDFDVAAEGRALGLRDKAIAKGRTTDGFVTMENLARTVRGTGAYATRTTSNAKVDDLVRSLEAGIPPIVLFPVEKDPKSANYGGPRATEPAGENLGHFAVIEGVFTDDQGRRWIVAQHGWRAEPYVWSEEEFAQSWGVRGSHMLEIKPRKNDNRRTDP